MPYKPQSIGGGGGPLPLKVKLIFGAVFVCVTLAYVAVLVGIALF